MAVPHASPAARVYRAALLWSAVLVFMAGAAAAAPFASFVIDARTGEVLESKNADARLHPASLTKMMTLYITFQAIQRGEITLDTPVTISRHAASEPPSKLGLQPGQKIKLRYLIRAAAIKSANDCATAIGEAIGGSEEAFAARMNATAKALGMTHSHFKNANGLTRKGHLSTARDMTILGRHLFYDFPQYYNLFSRRSAYANGKTVYSTNRKFLDAYDGADGIKTGYTYASGFNLVGSAERSGERIIATVFGGRSTADRNAKVMKLLDYGFAHAPKHVQEMPPVKPTYVAPGEMVVASADATAGYFAKSVRVSGLVAKSIRPRSRPGSAGATDAQAVAAAVADAVGGTQAGGSADTAPDSSVLASMQNGINDTLQGLQKATAPTEEAPVASIVAPPRPERTSDASDALAQDGMPELTASPLEQLASATESTGEGAVQLASADSQSGNLARSMAAALLPTAAEAANVAPDSALMGNASAQISTGTGPAVDTAAVTSPAADAPAAQDSGAAAVADAGTDNGTDGGTDSGAANDADTSLDLALSAESDDPAPGDKLDAAPVPGLARATTGTTAPAPAPGATVKLAAIEPETFPATEPAPRVVTRLSTSGGRQWGINVGVYNTQYEAEKILVKTTLLEIGLLQDATRKIGRGRRGWEANFFGMSQREAAEVCSRLAARHVDCNTLNPQG